MDTIKEQRIRLIQERIEDIVSRLPAHSIPKAMVLELDELEDELARLISEEIAFDDENV